MTQSQVRLRPKRSTSGLHRNLNVTARWKPTSRRSGSSGPRAASGTRSPSGGGSSRAGPRRSRSSTSTAGPASTSLRASPQCLRASPPSNDGRAPTRAPPVFSARGGTPRMSPQGLLSWRTSNQDLAAMIRVFEKSSPDFQRRLDALCNRSSELGADIEAAARKTIAKVRAGGDAAVRALTAEFDKRQLDALELPGGRVGRAGGARRARRASGARARRAAGAGVSRARAPRFIRDLRGRRARRQPRRSAGPHRHLRPGRQGPLPVDGDHDGHPGARRGRARDRDDARPGLRPRRWRPRVWPAWTACS